MKLPVVTKENLTYCKDLSEGLIARREEMLRDVGQYPLELTIDNEHLLFRVVMASRNEVDALVFGVALLVNSVTDAVSSGTYRATTDWWS
jgi:hypothetical protein